MEINDDLYMIRLKTENGMLISKKARKGDDDDDSDEDSLPEEKNKEKEPGLESPKTAKSPEQKSQDKKKTTDDTEKQNNANKPSGSRIVRNLSQLFDVEILEKGGCSGDVESSCINLLKAMELEDREEKWDEIIVDDEDLEDESLNLPANWLYGCSKNGDQLVQEEAMEIVSATKLEQQKEMSPEKVKPKRPRAKKEAWGHKHGH